MYILSGPSGVATRRSKTTEVGYVWFLQEWVSTGFANIALALTLSLWQISSGCVPDLKWPLIHWFVQLFFEYLLFIAKTTQHPYWRDMLAIVGDTSSRLYTGHPHDWVVSDSDDPVPLKQTYLQYDPQFSFTHLDSSIVDPYAFGANDPRQVAMVSQHSAFTCSVCGEKQSEDVTESTCRCFPNIFGSDHLPMAPVQIFRTKNGRNNGLMACCVSFPDSEQISENTFYRVLIC